MGMGGFEGEGDELSMPFEALVGGLAVVLGEIEVLIDGLVVFSEKLMRSSIRLEFSERKRERSLALLL